MALTWSRLLSILNGSALFFSLALVGISPAVINLASHGMQRMDKAWPEGHYQWYRGPSYDMDTKHEIVLWYDSTNEYMIFAAAAVSILAGIFGIFGFFLTRKASKPSSHKSTLLLVVLPGTVSFIVTFIAFTFTQIVFDTDNSGKCNWESGYNPDQILECTHEQAACNIVGYFTRDTGRTSQIYDMKREICGETQTGRHLVAPLFVASVLLWGLAVAMYLVQKRETRFVESADERVERLQGQKE